MIEFLEHRIAPANLAFAIGVGAGGTQSLSEIETDPEGNIYVSGTFVGSVDFDPGPSSVIRTADPGHTVAYVAKYSGIGTLAWVNTITYSDGISLAPELAVNPLGEVFLTARYGDTQGTSVQFLQGEEDTPDIQLFQPGTTSQVYVVKADTTGNFVWGQSFGTGAASLDSTDIVVSDNGIIYFAGTFANGSSGGTVNIGGTQLTVDPGESDLFLVSLFDDGLNPTVQWALDTVSAGFLAQIQGPKLALDSQGNVALAGVFSGQFSISGFTVASQDLDDYYVARVSTSGQAPVLTFAVGVNGGGTGLGNPGRDNVGIVVNDSNQILIAGKFTGTSDFDPGPGIIDRVSAGGSDLFVALYGPNGAYIDSEIYGDKGNETFLAFNRAEGGFVLAGTFEDTASFPIPDGAISLTAQGDDDIVLLSINGAGFSRAAQRLSMENGASGGGVLADFLKGGGFAIGGLPSGELIYGGSFRGTFDADPGAAVKNVTSKGAVDFFVAQLFPEGLSAQPLFPPALGLSFALGAAGDQSGLQVATDFGGRIYIAGIFKGTVDFDLGPGVVSRTASDPGGNYFLVQYQPDGELRWVQQVATVVPDDDAGLKIGLDVPGNVYLAGEYETSATIGAFTVNNADASGRRDVFVFKLNLNGVSERAITIGGAGGDEFVDAFGIVPLSGTMVIGGTFSSLTDFDPGTGTLLRAPNGSPGTVNSYVLGIDFFGVFDWFHQIAGTGGFGGPEAVGFLTNGDVIVAGNFGGTVDLDFGNSPVTITGNPNDDDIFLVRYDNLSGAIVTSSVIGGSRSDEVSAVIVNADNEIFIGGQFTGTLIIDAAPALIESGDGQGDGFIMKVDSNFGHLGAISLGSQFEERVAFLGLDANGTLVAGGSFSGTVDFDPGPGVATLTSTGEVDVFVARYDAATLGFQSAFRIEVTVDTEGRPGIDIEQGGAFWVDPAGNTYFTGTFSGSVDADVGSGVKKFASKGGFDLLFAKFSGIL